MNDHTHRGRSMHDTGDDRDYFLDAMRLDAFPVQIWLQSVEGVWLGANPAHARFMNRAVDALVGRSLEDLLGPEEAAACRLSNAAVCQGGMPSRVREWVVNARGERRLLDILKTPRLDDQGQVSHLLCVAEDVTEAHRLDQERREALARLQRVVDSIPDFIGLKDPDSRYLMINAGGATMFGRTPEACLGRTDEELTAHRGDAWAEAMRHCRRTDLEAWASGDDVLLETSLPRQDGSLARHHTRKRPFLDGNGRPEMLLVHSHDVEDLCASLEASRLDRLRLESILRGLPGMIFVHDAAGLVREIYANNETLLCQEREAALGRHVRDLLPSPAARRVDEALADVLARRREAVVDYDLPIAGVTRHFQACIVPHGENMALSVVRDITEQVEAQRTVRTLMTAIESAPAIFVITDANAVIQYVNAEFTRLTGYTASEALGQSPSLLKSGQHDAAYYDHVWAILKSGQTWRGEFCNRRKDGELYWEDAIIIPIAAASGQGVDAYVAIKYDITPMKRQQAELEAQTRAAQAASLAKSQFLSMMSHELRTPLNGILGLLQLVKEEVQEPSLAEYLTLAQRAGFGLVRLLTDLLTLAESRAAQPTMLTEFRLQDIVTDVMTLFTLQAREKGLSLSCRHCVNDQETLFSDEYRLRQIIFNLVANGIKFTDRGSVTLTCDVREENASVWLEVDVTDTGIGIAAEHLDRIFDAFQQVDQGLSRQFGGVGIGLSVVNRFAADLGGSIQVRSTPGEGSTLWLRTLVRRRRAPVEAASPAAAPGQPAPDLVVLCAEDERLNQLVVERYLASRGARVHCVGDGAQAVAQAETTRYDVILLDINMPVMDGFQALRAIRASEGFATPPNVPVIAVTAYSSEEDRETFLAHGFDDFFAKPVDLKSLHLRVEQLARASLSCPWPHGLLE